MGLSILLYVPNLIGYLRLLLLLVSWIFFTSNPLWSLITYTVSILLDAVDGIAARKLNQCSAFGAWFDIVIDILGRGVLWSRIYHFGYLVAALEWLTFVCTHTQGAQWKATAVEQPWWVKAVMADNFKKPLGVIAIGGLQVLPMWLYAHYMGVFTMYGVSDVVSYSGIAILAAGRALCMAVELFCIWCHILYLVSDEANRPLSKPASPESL